MYTHISKDTEKFLPITISWLNNASSTLWGTGIKTLAQINYNINIKNISKTVQLFSGNGKSGGSGTLYTSNKSKIMHNFLTLLKNCSK